MQVNGARDTLLKGGRGNSKRVSLDDILRWTKKGGWTLLDQSLFSGSNFLVSILLARWMEPEDFGAYAVGSSALLLASGFYNSLVLEPASVLGPSLYASHLEEYTKFYRRVHLWVSAPIGLVLAAIGCFLFLFVPGSSRVGVALLSAGIALPGILYIWWGRRSCYIQLDPRRASVVSLLYAFFVLGGLIVVHVTQGIGVVTAFMWMAVAGWCAPALMISSSPPEPSADNRVVAKEVFKENWSFGKWIALGTLLSVGAGQVQTFFVAEIVGLRGAALLRAMLNFVLPMALSITAIGTLALSSLSGDYGRKDFASLRRKGLFVSGALTIVAAMFALAIYLFAGQLEQVLYGGRYADGTRVATILALVPVFSAVATGSSIILRSMQKPTVYLLGSLSSAFVGIPTGWVFTKLWGVEGAAWSMALAFLASAVCTWYFYRQLAKPSMEFL